jgi:hypothetical protein
MTILPDWQLPSVVLLQTCPRIGKSISDPASAELSLARVGTLYTGWLYYDAITYVVHGARFFLYPRAGSVCVSIGSEESSTRNAPLLVMPSLAST